MVTEKKAFTMRLDKINYKKFQVIARKNRRSMAGELELVLENFIADYESKNGQIPFSEEGAQNNSVIFNNQVGDNNFQVTTV